MKLYLSRTKPFRNLQRHIGRSTYRLNTIFVGLDCVANGQGDSGAIGVTWKKPTEAKRAEVANQAKIFACTSALILGADVVDAFLREIVCLKWLNFSDDCVKVAAKTVTGPGGVEYSFADRANAICRELCLDEEIQVAGVDLLASWRNVVAHSNVRRAKLNKKTTDLLLESSQKIHENYSHLDIKLALENFEHRKPPVSKEVTSLLAMATNLCRAIDQAAIRRVASTGDKMDALVEQLLLDYFQDGDQRTFGAWSELSETWQGKDSRRRSGLKKIFQKLCVTEVDAPNPENEQTKARARRNPVSSPVSQDYLDGLLKLDRHEFAKRFDIPVK
ncbi:hypothetical protein K3555_16850 [Leisingera sp. M527]|uniref:hypothetical protein n=1 Tax=Leisingera sp. M527 TaxID=2867014 RepID=UPI0021A78B2C|nr:hypothetical protein [Leisingera sp. M527]UWQ32208.1 hypothetical protein K3555_16850 [Leisingera sp. M527]